MHVNISNSQVILATAIVYLSALNGERVLCRAVLDSGSQVSFVTKAFASKLCLPVHQSDLAITGIGQMGTTAGSAISAKIQSEHNSFKISVDLFLLPSITIRLPTCQINTSTLNIPHKIKISLADPNFDRSGPIDVLFGVDIFYNILQKETYEISKQVAARYTSLGWIITGRVPVKAGGFNTTFVYSSIAMNSTAALSLYTSIKNIKHQEE